MQRVLNRNDECRSLKKKLVTRGETCQQRCEAVITTTAIPDGAAKRQIVFQCRTRKNLTQLIRISI